MVLSKVEQIGDLRREAHEISADVELRHHVSEQSSERRLALHGLQRGREPLSKLDEAVGAPFALMHVRLLHRFECSPEYEVGDHVVEVRSRRNGRTAHADGA